MHCLPELVYSHPNKYWSFEIEKSADGIHFSVFQHVAANGGSSRKSIHLIMAKTFEQQQLLSAFEVKYWFGWLKCRKQEEIEFNGQVKFEIANDYGKWSAYLDPMPADAQARNMKSRVLFLLKINELLVGMPMTQFKRTQHRSYEGNTRLFHQHPTYLPPKSRTHLNPVCSNPVSGLLFILLATR